jgi:hypothetical protein
MGSSGSLLPGKQLLQPVKLFVELLESHRHSDTLFWSCNEKGK